MTQVNRLDGGLIEFDQLLSGGDFFAFVNDPEDRAPARNLALHFSVLGTLQVSVFGDGDTKSLAANGIELRVRFG